MGSDFVFLGLRWDVILWIVRYFELVLVLKVIIYSLLMLSFWVMLM